MATQTLNAPTARQWYIKVGPQAYGPFDDQTLWQYMWEGRVTAQSLITQNPQQPYRPISENAGLMNWLAQIPTNTQDFTVPQTSQSQMAASLQQPAHSQTANPVDNKPLMRPGQPAADAIAPRRKHFGHNQQSEQPLELEPLKPSVFIVMADIKSGQDMEFLKRLQSLGSAERIGDNLWLMQAVTTADQIRNTLSQPLGNQDRLFILDSFKNHTAWFNIGPEMDKRIRNLWDVERG